MLCAAEVLWTLLLHTRTKTCWHCYMLMSLRGRDRAAGADEDHLVWWQSFYQPLMIQTYLNYCLDVVSDDLTRWCSVCSLITHHCSQSVFYLLAQIHWARTNGITKSFQCQIWARFPFPLPIRFLGLSHLNFLRHVFPSQFSGSPEGLWAPSGSF